MTRKTEKALDRLLTVVSQSQEEESPSSCERIAEDFLSEHPDCEYTVKALAGMVRAASVGGEDY